MHKTFWIFLVALAVLPAGLAAEPQADYKGKTILDGAFTAEQATRGQAAYSQSCERCHGADLGSATPLREQRFIDRWREAPLDFVFSAIKDTMPRGNGGSLSDQAYLDIVAYILQHNGYPTGPAELTTSALNEFQFVDATGPKAVPNLTIVRVVGCMTPAPNDIWNLTAGSEPVRTRQSEEISADETKMGEAAPLGAHTFRLNLDNLVVPFDAAPHAGHKMLVKGVLNRQATGQRINVTGIGMVAERCAP